MSYSELFEVKLIRRSHFPFICLRGNYSFILIPKVAQVKTKAGTLFHAFRCNWFNDVSPIYFIDHTIQ